MLKLKSVTVMLFLTTLLNSSVSFTVRNSTSIRSSFAYIFESNRNISLLVKITTLDNAISFLYQLVNPGQENFLCWFLFHFDLNSTILYYFILSNQLNFNTYLQGN